MPSLDDLKKRIKSVKSTQKITKAYAFTRKVKKLITCKLNLKRILD